MCSPLSASLSCRPITWPIGVIYLWIGSLSSSQVDASQSLRWQSAEHTNWSTNTQHIHIGPSFSRGSLSSLSPDSSSNNNSHGGGGGLYTGTLVASIIICSLWSSVAVAVVVVVAVRESPAESTQSLSLSPRVVVSREGERERETSKTS